MLKLFQIKAFFLVWMGNFASVLAGHIVMIAFSWLVLKLTGSAFQMGLVLGVQGLPRAILMLYGGATVDRLSPKLLMVTSNYARFFIIVIMALLIGSDNVLMLHVYLLALIFGIVDAFFYPASGSILPSLVDRDALKKANALFQTTTQTAVFISPAVAGLLIALAPSPLSEEALAWNITSRINDGPGLALAFAIASVCFVISGVLINFANPRALHTDTSEPAGVFVAVKEALLFVWHTPAMRIFFIGIAMVNIFFNAPFLIGIPIIAEARFENSAAAFGYIVSAFGAGALISGFSAGFLPNPDQKTFAVVGGLLVAFLGVVWAGLAFVPTLTLAVAIMFAGGLANGVVMVFFVTWVQKSTPDRLLGRVMSIMSFVFIGLLPIADSFMGLALEWNLELVMFGSGMIIVAISLLVTVHPDARKVPRRVDDADYFEKRIS
jgi:MFS family permease